MKAFRWLWCVVLAFTLLLLSQPVLAAGEELLVVDTEKFAVLRYNAVNGSYLGDITISGPANPINVHIGPDGDLYVTIGEPNAVMGGVLRFDGRTYAPKGTFIAQGEGDLSGPEAMVFRPDGEVYVADFKSANVKRYDATTGAFLGNLIDPGVRDIGNVSDMVLGPNGHLYLGMANSQTAILEVDAETGAVLHQIPGAQHSYGIVFGPDGLLYATSLALGNVVRYNPSTRTYLAGFTSSAQLRSPLDVDFGRDGAMFVADSNAGGVYRFNGSTGAFQDTFIPKGSGGLIRPFRLRFHNPTAIPEPASLALLAVAIPATALCRRRVGSEKVS